MTYKELLASEREALFPDDVAKLLGVHPQSIREQAKNDPASLGFPVIRVGAKTLIPRRAFINFLNGGTQR